MACGLHCLKIEHIGVTVGKERLLWDVNLHAHCGELTAIIGRNGAGKSTLLKAILGELPHTGTVAFSGPDNAPVARRPVIGYVPQHLTTDSNAPATVEDMALAFSSSWPVFLPHRRRTVDKLRAHFARFEAAELLSHPVGRLSGGELQRVLLAIATLPKPDLLVLDEPVSGVDHTGLQTLYRMVEQLKQEDMVILMVTHDLAYVREHADRVLLLNKTVEACGTPQDVFATDAFRRAFPEGGWQHV